MFFWKNKLKNLNFLFQVCPHDTGATTSSLMAFSIMTPRIVDFIETLSITTLGMFIECLYAERRILLLFYCMSLILSIVSERRYAEYQNHDPNHRNATTLGIMTLSITKFSIMTLIITTLSAEALSILGSTATLRIWHSAWYSEYRCTECSGTPVSIL